MIPSMAAGVLGGGRLPLKLLGVATYDMPSGDLYPAAAVAGTRSSDLVVVVVASDAAAPVVPRFSVWGNAELSDSIAGLQIFALANNGGNSICYLDLTARATATVLTFRNPKRTAPVLAGTAASATTSTSITAASADRGGIALHVVRWGVTASATWTGATEVSDLTTGFSPYQSHSCAITPVIAPGTISASVSGVGTGSNRAARSLIIRPQT